MVGAFTPLQKREACARTLGRKGYALSESAVTVGVYLIHKPGVAEPYIVDVAGQTCTCPDFAFHGAPCKHQIFVEICCRYWLYLQRKPVVVQPAPRRRFAQRRLAAFRRFAPSLAAAKPSPVVTITTTGRKILSSAEIARRIALDF